MLSGSTCGCSLERTLQFPLDLLDHACKSTDDSGLDVIRILDWGMIDRRILVINEYVAHT